MAAIPSPSSAPRPSEITQGAAGSVRAAGCGQTGRMRRGVVLGGGGIAGVAWEAGIVIGLRRAGVDLSSADVIVGTSAGAIVGAHVAFGTDLQALAAMALAPAGAGAAVRPGAGSGGGPPPGGSRGPRGGRR